ncbi:hypothetical protein Pmani_039349 [Petrolisthes manimaculis]|uniref:Sugar transporter SWEET n=1 Tax=Petrolisthes manimaculis TaxID=1843537 RepID=A0AAE1NCS0_9EUCA|nr:hypothetical protein Pmani_039349 [Petrolisthes manimaculis]
MLSDYRDTIAITATILTILQFLSGTDICRRIVKQGATGDISGFPFVGGVFSTSVWLTYSLLLNDLSMSVTNAVGLALQMIYLFIYTKYCISPGAWYATRRQMAALVTVVAIAMYYVLFSGAEPDVIKTRVGLLCCLGSIVFCAAPLVSLTQVFSTQCTDVLPFPLILATFLVTGLWWLYGLILQDPFVQYPNLIGCGLAGFQLLLFVVYPAHRKGTVTNGESRPV